MIPTQTDWEKQRALKEMSMDEERDEERELTLGDQVEDSYSGYRGMVVGIAYYLTGCVTCCVKPYGLDDAGKPIEGEWLDSSRLVLLEETEEHVAIENTTGGPQDSVPSAL